MVRVLSPISVAALSAMDTHVIINQYAEWGSIAKTWLLSLSKLEAFTILTTLWTVYRIGVYTYRLFLHPLSKYPGPRLAAASSIYEMYHDVSIHCTFGLRGNTEGFQFR